MTSFTPSPRHARRIKVGAFALVVALIPVGWATTQLSANAAVPDPPAGMKILFSDDFEGPANTAVVGANWKFDLGTGYPGGAANWGTGEVETMTDALTNVSLDGQGHLAITPQRDAAGNWTSGRIETQRTDFAAPEGGKLRIEASLQQPNVSGAAADGYWPAFWALGAEARTNAATTWPSIGEWDIMESVNGRESYFHTLHCGVNPGGPCNETSGISSGEKACAGCKTGFHSYAVEYDRGSTPQSLTWFVDGERTFSVTQAQVDEATWNNATQHGMFVILNVAMGGAFPVALGTNVTDNTVPGTPMLVDHVTISATA